MKAVLNTIILCLLISILSAQNGSSYEDYFISPVQHKIRLAGSFGELRPNHFHAGIDIKPSNGKSGDPILASADGFISRIKVQISSYGRAIYIDHPNGYTTVYAHLSAFNDTLSQYVYQNQKDSMRYSVDLYPVKGRYKVKKGDVIGFMGNAGRSYAPHLHFEIRETESETPVNPFLFNIQPTDSKPPFMTGLFLYKLDPELNIQDQKSYKIYKNGNNYRTGIDTISFPAWRAGIGLKVYDQMDGSNNWNGNYQLDLMIDDQLVYQYKIDKVSFDETKFINAHIDYESKKKHNASIQKCWFQPGNNLGIYTHRSEDCIIKLFKDEPRECRLIATDLHGNKSELKFYVKRASDIKEDHPSYHNYLIHYDSINVIRYNDLQLVFPKKSLYQDERILVESTPSSNTNHWSEIYFIADKFIPLHRNIEFLIKTNSIPEELQSKAFLAKLDDKGITSLGGEYENGYLKGKLKYFGKYVVMLDTIKPEIGMLKARSVYNNGDKLKFKITDNISVEGNAKDLQYTATIDGEWVLMEYDLKTNTISHKLRDLEPGIYDFNLVVWDDRLNRSTFTKKITIK